MGLFTERDEETPNQIILGKLNRIEAKLDAVIKALHEYDDDQLDWPEPNDALLKAAGLYNELEANKRMDIIGQNGNEGTHYVTNEEADEDAKINKPAKHVGKKDNPKQMNGVESNVPFIKTRNKRDKWVSPYPPNPKRKSAIDEHVKHPPHKH